MRTTNKNLVKVNEVINKGYGTADLRAEIIKLGFSAEETAQLICERRRRRAIAHTPLTFGIELEVVGVTDRTKMLAETAARGLNAQYEGYNHRDNSHYYKFVSDASICGAGGIECVSPILTEGKAGFDSVKNICAALRAAGASVNKSTGYHIHVGGDITNEQYVNVFHNYKMLQSLIDSFMPQSRRGSCRWCKSLASYDFSRCSSPFDVNCQLGHDRYHAVNADAWSRHRTIEFRQHAGTINAEKVLMWATFCIKLVAWSRKNRFTGPVSFIEDIPFLTPVEARYFAGRKAHLEEAAQYA